MDTLEPSSYRFLSVTSVLQENLRIGVWQMVFLGRTLAKKGMVDKPKYE